MCIIMDYEPKKTILISVAACLAWGSIGLADKANASGVTITSTKIDRDFIREMEGSSLTGYVPLVKTTNSGVTIAHGFDLGSFLYVNLIA